MILKSLNSKIKALAICTGFFSLSACREHSISSGGLVPDVDNINTFALSATDFNISFKNGLTDSIVTSTFGYSSDGTSSSVPAIIVGTYNDPIFGRTQSIAHFQVTPYSSNFSFVENSIKDSAVLVLPYKYGTLNGAYFGDTLSTIKWNVYKMDDALEKSKTYYSNSNTPLGTLIGSATFTFKDFNLNSQQVISAKDTTYGQLRIKLDNNFAQYLFNADSNDLSNTTEFLKYLKGISIAPDMSVDQNMLAYFLLPTPSTTNQNNLGAARIELHYHVDTTSYFSSLVMRNSVCAYYSNIIQNRVGYPVSNMLNRNTTDSILIQNLPGLKTDITIKGLKNIPQSVINKAEMVITVQKQQPTNPYYFLSASNLVIPVLVENDKEIPMYERIDNTGALNATGIYMINPYVSSVDINGTSYSQYRLNIPRSIQKYMIDGKDEITIRLKGSNYYPGMDRILAKGLSGTNDGTNFQLNIIYTKRQN